MNTTRKTSALLGVVAFFVASGLAYSFWSYNQLELATAQRKQSRDIFVAANSLMSAIKDAESNQRGYALSADIAYLERYMVVREPLQKDLQALRQSTQIPQALVHLDATAPMLTAKIAWLDQLIALQRENRGAAAVALFKTNEGTRLMDAIGDEFSAYLTIQEAAQLESVALFNASMRRLFAILVCIALSALLLALYFAKVRHRASLQRLEHLMHLDTLQMNHALQASEQKLLVTLNSIGEAVIATDAASCITLLNPVAEKLTGWSQTQALGLPVNDVFYIVKKATRERASVPVDQALAHGTVQRLTNHTVLIARDGREFDIADSCAPIRDAGGQIMGAVLVFRNVTEEHAAQQTLRDSAVLMQDKNAELEAARAVADKANLAKSEFLSSMSHELRSPLNAILGFAQLMESSTPEPSAAQKDSIDHILRAGWYLLQLINEILDLALIESGKLSMSMEPTSLPEILSDCQAMMEPQARKRGITMRFPQFSGPCVVDADSTRVKQVLVNLLTNAIKYNRVNGSVDVTYVQDDAGHLRISVRDTGQGLSPQKITQLFQPFNRLGQEASAEEGTGIGLVMSKRLVELMGGRIGVHTTLGVGSEFWVELNLAEPIKLELDATDPLSTLSTLSTQVCGDMQACTLLYVEDNQANMELVAQLLTRRPDMRLLSANDGMRGVTMARSLQPDLILMDINLPGISGLQALKRLREDPATQHIPVMALSANAMPRDIEKGMQAGFYRYLTKPIKIAEFMEALDLGLAMVKTRAQGEVQDKAQAKGKAELEAELLSNLP